MFPKPWDIVSSERRDRLRIFALRVDRAVSPRTGKAHDFYVLESGSWVNVIPLTPAREKEDIHVLLKPLAEIPRLIREGAITHSLVVAAFYRLFMEHPPLASVSAHATQ